MNRLVLFSLFVLTAVTPARAADVAASVMEPYLRIQVALANDSLASIRGDAALVSAGAARAGEAGRAMAVAADKLQKASDLTAARDAFGELSDALLAYARASKSGLGPDRHVAYCPMVKKHWVQTGKAILNPFGGKKMQACGEIVPLGT